MTTARPIDSALRDQNLLGAALGDPSSWSTWLVTLRGRWPARSTSSSSRPSPLSLVTGAAFNRVRELWCVVGRGGGKSRMAAACAVHTALLQHHQLAPGEVGHVLVLSPTVAQAKVVFGYCMGFIEQSPVLARNWSASRQ